MQCTPRIKKLIKSGRRLQIHSVYRHTVNLKAEDCLIALHPDFIERTPLSATLSMSEAEFEKFALYAQDQNSFYWDCGYLISENGFRWKTGELQTWNAKLETRIKQQQQQLLAKKIREFLLPLGDGGMSNAAVSFKGKEDSLVTSVLRKQVQDILCASPKERISAITPLIGMGMGLTPSGDDFIVGLLLAYHSSEQRECETELKELITAVLENITRTNDVSSQYLLCACEGEFGIKLHRLIKESNDVSKIRENLKNIQQTGHSSGIDTLNGISVGLTLLQRNEF